MLHEASIYDILFLQDARNEETGERPILVCVMRYYPASLGKGRFDIFAPDLGPPLQLRKRFKELENKFLNIAHGMRSWGTTIEERRRIGRYKAFRDAYGTGSVYLRRYWRNNAKAQAHISTIRELAKTRDVFLISSEKGPPSHRYVLMQLILGNTTMSKMFVERKYKQEYLDFANYIDKRLRRAPMREF